MRVTVVVKNVGAVSRRLETKDRVVRAALKKEVKASGERVFASAQDLTPVDTGFMRDALRLSFHRNDYTYHVGWYAEDFVGSSRIHGWSQTRPQPRPFYVPPVVFGTATQAGRDPLTPSLEADKASFIAGCDSAMRTRAG